MKLATVKFTFILLLFTVVRCQTFSLIGSHFIRPESTYSIFLSTGLSDKNVQGNLSFNILGQTKVQIFGQLNGNLQEIKLNIPKTNQPFCDLKVQYSNSKDKSCKQQSIKLLDITKRPLIFIQTDKPIYKVGEIIKLQVFVLTQKLVPFRLIDKMTVTVLNADGEKFEQITDAKTTKFGVYEMSILIPNESKNYGKWNVQINVNGKKASKNFEVRKFDENAIQLNIVTDKIVAFEDYKIYMTINAKHPQNKHFSGPVDIFLTGQLVDSDNIAINNVKVKSFDISSTKNDIQMKIKDDLDIHFPNSDMLLNFTVKFTDKSSKISTVVTQILLKHNGRKDISTIKRKFFKPNLDFPVIVQVRHIDGRPDNSFGELDYLIKYFNGGQLEKQENFKTVLTKGYVSLNLSPSAATNRIETSYDFDKAKLNEVIKPVESSTTNEYLQANLIKKNAKSAFISVKSTEAMESLYVMVTSPFGIVNNTNHPQAQGQRQFNLTIDINCEMRPESSILVYYFSKLTGAIIHDTFTLVLGFSTVNTLDIQATEIAKPGSQIDLNISTDEKSMVYATAVEHDVPSRNEITKHLIDKMISSYKSIKFMNNSESFGVFIVDSSSWKRCNESEDNTKTPPDDDFEDDGTDSFNAENIISNYIPNVLFSKSIEIAGPSNVVSETANSVGSYRIHGVSVHPSNGLSVIKNQPKILISTIIELKMDVPDFLYEGETVQIDYTILNHYKKQMTLEVDVNIENGKIVEESSNLGKGKKYEIKLSNQDFKSKQSISISTSLNVKVLKIKIRMTSKPINLEESIEKQINVRKLEKKMESIVKSSYLICLNKTNKSWTMNDTVDIPKGYKMYARLHKNLLSPSLSGPNSNMSTPISYNENSVDNLAALTVASKYFKLSESKESNKTVNKLQKSYINFIPIINPILSQNSSSDVRLVAYTAQVLIDMKEIINIDEQLIQDCLSFIKNQQYENGSFPYNSDLNLRRDIGSKDGQEFILTALATMSLIKGKSLMKDDEELENSLAFLNDTNLQKYNIEKAVAAYVIALNDDSEKSKNVLNKIKKKYQQEPMEKHKSLYIEVASYTILAKILNNIDPYEEVKWLIKQRKTDGSFYSSYDTALALQALFEYTKYKNIPKSNLSIKLNNKPVEDDGKSLELKSDFNLEVTGEGMEYVTIYYEGEDKEQTKQENLTVIADLNKLKDDKFKIVANVTSDLSEILSTNMVIIEVKFPRGYVYVSHEGENIRDAVQNDGSSIALQISKMEGKKIYTYSFDVQKVFDIKSSIKPYIKAYDYYRTNLMAICYYNYEQVK